MDANEKTNEFTGQTVEEAIELGLSDLGVTREQVEVTVVDEGRSGFLGIGNREAVVQMRVKESTSVQEAAVPAAALEETGVDETDDDESFDDLENLPDPDLLEEEEVAGEVLETLFAKMGLRVSIDTSLGQPDELGKQVVNVVIVGDKLDDLIGPRGEGMVDLQFLSRLMVSQKLRRRVNFLIDINNYRGRKEEGLVKLANRMAEKVTQRGNPVTLEPMNSYERRLIHLALRESKRVYTRSVGEGHARRVRIYPKN